MTDHNISITLEGPDGIINVFADAITDEGPSEYHTAHDATVGEGSEEVETALIATGRIIAIGGDADALADLSDPAPSGLKDAMQTRGVGGDRMACPECGGDVSEALGAPRACADCGWTVGND